MSHLENVKLPRFGGADEPPAISTGEYQQRLEAVVERMCEAGLDFLVVYADREHFANIRFLTGFDPRFEEALLVLDTTGKRLLLVGNECLGYLPDAALGLQVTLHQDFSLLGQPRGRSLPLAKVLCDFGIRRGSKVGVAGWKYYDARMVNDPDHAIESPSYIVDILRELAGERVLVRNATSLFVDPQNGLRILNSASQIAAFEYGATRSSEGVLTVLKALGEGKREIDLADLLRPHGLPLSCHPVLSFGEQAKRCLQGPTANAAKRGDAYVIGFGVWGSLTCRAGVLAAGPEELPEDLGEFYEAFVANYFDVFAAWYEHLRVGAVAGEVFEAAEAKRDGRLYDFALNPGHYIHLDEWTHSPFAPDSRVELRSGMAIQMDIIPVSKGPFCNTNAEDGLVLADERLRAELQRGHPDCWKRMQRRRRFLKRALGIRLDESVLPLGNTSGWLPPYGLDLGRALVAERE